jgi:hypothetical protein
MARSVRRATGGPLKRGFDAFATLGLLPFMQV